jgi:hypothetical protein
MIIIIITISINNWVCIGDVLAMCVNRSIGAREGGRGV